jgi:hypothetical protein
MKEERFKRLLEMGLENTSEILLETGNTMILKAKDTRIGITKNDWDEFKIRYELIKVTT